MYSCFAYSTTPYSLFKFPAPPPPAPKAVSAGQTGKKKKDLRRWYDLPNGLRIYATPERYRSFIERHPETVAVQEVPAERTESAPLNAAESSDRPVGEAPAQPEPETYEGPLLGAAPKSEIKLPETESDLRASLAAAKAAREDAERLAKEQFDRENLEEEEAVILEIIMKELAD